MEVDEGSDQKSDMYPHWMCMHMKNEFTEDEKFRNLITWLSCVSLEAVCAKYPLKGTLAKKVIFDQGLVCKH